MSSQKAARLTGAAIRLSCFALLFSVLAFGQNASDDNRAGTPVGEQGCALAGSVTNLRTGQALGRATVRLSRMDAGESADYAAAQQRQLGLRVAEAAPAQSAISDENGKFCFAKVEKGQYRLSGRKRGFLDTNYGAASPTETGRALNIGSRQPQFVTLALLPQSTVSGVAIDADGDTVDAGSVQLLSRLWIRGSFRYVAVKGSAVDEMGEFRVVHVTPGTYYVLFQPGGGDEPGIAGAAQQEARIRPVRTFYPGTTRLAQAIPVQVGVGDDVANLQIKVQRMPLHRLRGRITGAVPKSSVAAISINPEDEDPTALVLAAGSIGPDNTFDFRNIAPGAYNLTYIASSGRSSSVVRQVVNVMDADVNDASIDVPPPLAIRGRLRFDDDRSFDVSTIPIQLTSMQGLVAPTFPAAVQRDGTFVINDVSPGKYLLKAAAPPGTYLKAATYGQANINGREFDVAGGSAEVQIVFHRGGAAVEGALDSAQGSGDAGKQDESAYFLLVPAISPPDGSGLRFGPTDRAGRFAANDLPPGKYYGYGFRSLDLTAVHNPNVLKAVEPYAVSIDLEEDDQKSITLHVVPAREASQAFGQARGQ